VGSSKSETNNVFFFFTQLALPDGLPLWANNTLTNQLRVNLILTSLPTDGRVFTGITFAKGAGN